MFAALLGTVAAASAAEFPPGFEQAVRAQAAPPSKLNPAIDPRKGNAVESLGDGAYFVTDGLYQAMFVVTRKGVVLVDAPPTLGTKLPKAIAEVTRRPVRYFIYSHEHADHTGSAHPPLDSVPTERGPAGRTGFWKRTSSPTPTAR